MSHRIDHSWTWTVIPVWAALLVLLTELAKVRADSLLAWPR